VPGASERDWRWLRWLPHLGNRVATSTDEVDAVLRGLGELLDRRRASGAAGRDLARSPERPNLALLVDGDLDAGQRGRLAALLADGPALGVTALALARDAASVMTPCAVLITPCGDAGTTVRCRGPGSSDGDDPGVVADQVEYNWAERIARALAPLRDARRDRASVLPHEVHLVDLIGASDPTPDAMRRRWAECDGGAGTVLGVGPDGALHLDLARDGPHLLIAGTTGSGKSELLQTLVAGMASEHPPSAMTFLLVDYKGGAAFSDCVSLPHTIGLVTDLDERMTARVLASLDSEIRRRETMFAAAGTPDLPGYRAGGGDLARLVLVVDEFATLADELPDFVSGLVSIAQRGRSLGLHLVLATQRPAGVVSPEIRANLTLRICLRVADVGESGDVIDAPHAAAVDRRTPGRGFLRAGPQLLAVQAARVAACAPREDTAVAITPLDAWRRPLLPAARTRDGPTDLSRIVAAARGAAAGSPAPHRPWLPPLPSRVELESLDDEHRTRPGCVDPVPIGLVDLPEEQRQVPLTIDVGAGGTILVAGSARSGRSTLLRTLALARARRSQPDRLHVHAIAASGVQLRELAALPHAGTIATTRHGFELAARLITRLGHLLATRRDLASAALESAPAVLFLLDGWEAFLAGAEEYDGGRTAERLHALLADAPAARATVVITGGRAVLTPRLSAHAATRLVLTCHDPADYAAAGLDPRAVPPPLAGRGIRATDRAEFQIAVATSARPSGARDPTVLCLRELPRQVELRGLPAPPGRIVLGAGGDTADPLAVDLWAGGGRLVVAGPTRSGRSQTLITVLHQARCRRSVVFAPRRSPLAAAAHRHGVCGLAPDAPVDAVDPALRDAELVLVDDLEAFADTAVGDALTRWARDAPPGPVVCAAGRCDALAVTFRGLGAELRQARCGVLLQPGPVDGELFGARLPRARPAVLPGRGVVFPDPAWGHGAGPVPIQIAVSPCADTCDPSAGRSSP
jgi:DNA segregation ATPase FtsK/SpoIIIE, S-DNA-T family